MFAQQNLNFLWVQIEQSQSEWGGYQCSQCFNHSWHPVLDIEIWYMFGDGWKQIERLGQEHCSTWLMCNYKLDVRTRNQLGNPWQLLHWKRAGRQPVILQVPFVTDASTSCLQHVWPYCTHTQHWILHNISSLSKHNDGETSNKYQSFCWHYKLEWLGFERPQSECFESRLKLQLEALTLQIKVTSLSYLLSSTIWLLQSFNKKTNTLLFSRCPQKEFLGLHLLRSMKTINILTSFWQVTSCGRMNKTYPSKQSWRYNVLHSWGEKEQEDGIQSLVWQQQIYNVVLWALLCVKTKHKLMKHLLVNALFLFYSRHKCKYVCSLWFLSYQEEGTF